jgi:hypothetical protein
MLFDNSLHDIQDQARESDRREWRLNLIAAFATLLAAVAIAALVFWL